MTAAEPTSLGCRATPPKYCSTQIATRIKVANWNSLQCSIYL